MKQNVRMVLTIFAVVVAVVSAAVAQTQPTTTPSKTPPPAEYKIPPEAAQKVNPLKPSPEGTARAKKVFHMDCAICHGESGDGKSDMAADLKNLSDFTKPETFKDRTDGELFYMIRTGKGDMPPEDNRAKDNDVWNLVIYVRAMTKK